MDLDIRLHPKQGQAFLSEATEILFGGAAGGGKSHLIRAASIIWCTDIPGIQGYLFRRTLPDLWKNHMEGPGSYPAILAPWIDAKLVKINLSKNYIEFFNHSKIHLCHCQYPKDVIKYQGAEIHFLMVDEKTHWTKAMYAFLRSRMRLGSLELPEKYKGLFPRALNGANPGGIGHNWVKFDHVDFAAPYEIKRAPRSEGGLKRQFIPAVLEDNPTLLKNDPDYEMRLEGLGEANLVKAMRDGNWDIVQGGAIDDVWSPAIHIVRGFDIPSSWRIDRSFDWGSSKPYSVGWWAESDGCEVEIEPGVKRTFPAGTLFRVHELYGWNGKPNEGLKHTSEQIAKAIKDEEAASRFLKGRRVLRGPADSSIWDTLDGDSIATKMSKKGVNWNKANKSPGTRKLGLELLRGRLRASTQSPMEDPGLFVFENCRQWLRTAPTLPRDDRDPDVVDTDAEDHAYDETRYRLLVKKPGRSYAKEIRV